MTAGHRQPIRFPLMALGIAALLAALWGGLLRMGWLLPLGSLATAHGPLMVCGFLGTLIGVERAVALGASWTYTGPLFTALGAVALVTGTPAPAAPLLMAAGSLVLVGVFVVIAQEQPTLFVFTMGLGAVCWCVGNCLWLTGQPIFEVVSWWLGFLVLTIAGERLELRRMRQLTGLSQGVFLVLVLVLVAGLCLGGVAGDAGARVTGATLVGLAVWLLQQDVARRTVRQRGLPRFTAACLLAGYVWLGAGGVLALRDGAVIAGVQYDAVLHAVFLGFVFSMIFGHAPIILPAVLGLPVPMRPALYAPLVLLHASVLLRLLGDLMPSAGARQWGGMLNAAAIVFFLLNTAHAVWGARRARRVAVPPIRRVPPTRRGAA